RASHWMGWSAPRAGASQRTRWAGGVPVPAGRVRPPGEAGGYAATGKTTSNSSNLPALGPDGKPGAEGVWRERSNGAPLVHLWRRYRYYAAWDVPIEKVRMPVTTVNRWTGREAKLLRQALRLSVRDFAAHLGVGVRTVNKWEARQADIIPLPYMQEVLDTALAQASDEAKARLLPQRIPMCLSIRPRSTPGRSSKVRCCPS